MSLAARCWSPVPGDQRLACDHERDGDTRPAIWNLETGDFERFQLDLEGEVSAADWWPDGSALLLHHIHEGRSHLHRYDLATGGLTRSRPSRLHLEGASPPGRERVVRA